MPHGLAQRGHCRWCGGEIRYEASHKKAGELNQGRNWHPDCVTEYKLHAFPELQYSFVARRDGEKCRACGETPERWHNRGLCSGTDFNGEKLWLHCMIERRVWLYLDHVVPLWSVQGIGPLERIKFYGPTNLQLLCKADHDRKTKREAAERAHFDRLEREARGEPKSARPKRDWPSREFPERQDPWGKEFRAWLKA